jgi:hypothetical protein
MTGQGATAGSAANDNDVIIGFHGWFFRLGIEETEG